MASFYPNWAPKSPISKYRHIRIRASMYEFGGDTVQSMESVMQKDNEIQKMPVDSMGHGPNKSYRE